MVMDMMFGEELDWEVMLSWQKAQRATVGLVLSRQSQARDTLPSKPRQMVDVFRFYVFRVVVTAWYSRKVS